MLSRLGMAYRPLPAGPLTAVAGLQLQGRPIEARYALWIGCDDPYAMADDAFLPLELVHASGGGVRPARGSALEIEGAEVSAVRRAAGLLEVRVFNPTDEHRPGGKPLGLAGRSPGPDPRGLRRIFRAAALRYRHLPLRR